MANRPVNAQIRSYFGLDGLPLNGGYLYFGSPGLNPQTNAITVYWDAALTQVAPQPIRTVGGFAVRNGVPTNVFASGDFSSTVRDSKGRLVYTSANDVDFQTAGTTAAADVTIADAGGFYTGTDVEAALQEVGTSLASLATGNLPTGALVDYCGTTAPSGFVIAGGGTIGNAASNATQRNNADTATLYTLLWNSSTNTELPIQDSAGSATTRGASAAADFAANKRMPLPDLRGRVRGGKDDMGVLGAASRITNALSGFVGSTQFAAGGSQTHTLTTAELPAHAHTLNAHTHSLSSHTHTISHSHAATQANHTHSIESGNVAGATPGLVPITNTGNVNIQLVQPLITVGLNDTADSGGPSTANTGANSSNSSSTGSDTAHRNVQPTLIMTVIIKL